ncbi:MAG: RagB/SusD family nutrient uptake outer membrane protein, partial [Muribaculaceae bacterium]|nr:RagB/SusD family nutrient uptake outer membrane protein [Muribaculaceae bacterium]
MKKQYIALSLFAMMSGATLLSGCADSLDSDKYFDDRRTIESVFTDINQTNGWLTQAFSFLKYELADVITKDGATGLHCFADDMYFGDRDVSISGSWDKRDSYSAFKRGDYDENFGSAFWTNAYKGIYQASIFIKNIDLNDKLTEDERLDMKGQARFVRAYYYWLLLRKYGPVPIMPDEGADYTLSYTQLSTPRSNYEECAEFVASEMLQAANELQSWSRFKGNTDQESMIRPTKGAALAVRAIAYIYAASPLANGQLANGDHPAGISDAFAKSFLNKDGSPMLSLTYDESKWARAAAACRDVIECPAGYELYHAGLQLTDARNTGYPKTITPPADNDFSEKNWPEGWADIDPYLSYRDFFNGVVGLDNSEIIFSRGYNTANQDDPHRSIDGFVVHSLPNTLFGYNCHGLTQKMVDAYYMNDGTDCPGKDSEMGEGDGSQRRQGWTTSRGDNASSKYPPLGQGVSMQYAEREPRFYASVAFNGSYWWNANPEKGNSYMQVFYWRGTNTVSSSDGTTTTETNGYDNTGYYLRTGIGVKKWVHPSDWRTVRDHMDYSHIVRKWEPAIRYADILLLYAEALNELNGSYTVASWDGTQTYNVSRDVVEMKRGIRPVRCRAGVPDYTSSEYSDQTTLRKKIKRERMIELMGEGKRYYDLRRWMDAPIEEAKPVYGCNVLMTNKQQDEFQQIVPVYSLPNVFSDKMYFWPFATDELKRKASLVQN